MLKINTEEGFTGLEAAIVLIAFVVVAAVFSYVVLGAGFFTTQKAQQVVYSSVDQASSSVEVLGNVYGIGDDGDSSVNIDQIRFSVGLTAGGSPVDFSQTTIAFSNADNVSKLERQADIVTGDSEPKNVNPGNWSVVLAKNNKSDDLLLENEEHFVIVANPLDNISSNQDFTLDLRPAVGTSYTIARSAPARIQGINTLY
ncbi:flagellin FlaB [Methanomicrobium sp. W14]|uniref:archaellin/type IV pilin N-terminal domain-containing protein n=1 Tax=Methanomicrobium sp. W14 TaxID=2817839 RepID=UPI001AE43930|nr:archaellin/type IV pilin N-terminal domain-containing protein [Methanomicrobium sp. W14]MBP2132973.1 flagellin FlaB [Methanomicrobium sp. W14]